MKPDKDWSLRENHQKNVSETQRPVVLEEEEEEENTFYYS